MCVREREREINDLPKIGLIELFVVEGFIIERGNVEVAPGREHTATGLEPLLGVEVRF